MANTANLEQTLLETVRSLLLSQQEAVLDFARLLVHNRDHLSIIKSLLTSFGIA
jgi:hypothetical protein